MANDAQIMLELFFAIYFALIIDRSHVAYNPYDTYSAWTGKSPDHRRHSDEELSKRHTEMRPGFLAHFIPGLLYILLTILVLILIVHF
jgi:hypothetical protein